MAESGTAVVLSDRMALEALIGVVGGTALSGGGPTTYNMALPPGIGDVLFLDCMVTISSIATVAPLVEEYGTMFALNTNDGARRQIIGVGKLYQNYDSQVSASPEKVVLPILWRQDESLFLTVPEVDTNGAPTALWNVWARVVRVRQAGSEPSPTYNPASR